MNNETRNLNWMNDDYDFNCLLHPSDFPEKSDRQGLDHSKPQPQKALTEKDLADATRSSESAAGIIEKYFRKKITIAQNGRSIRATIYEAIILTLYTAAMTGNQQALAALVRYSKFGGTPTSSKKSVVALYETDDGVYMQQRGC